MLLLKEVAVLCSVVLLCLPLKAQDPTEKSLWYDIITVETDITYADLVSVSEDSLVVENVRGQQTIALDDLIGIRVYKKSPDGIVGICILTGVVLGGALGAKAQKEAEERYENSDALIKLRPAQTGWGILLGGVFGAIVGGIAKANGKKDEYFDMRQRTRNQMIAFLKRQPSIRKGR